MVQKGKKVMPRAYTLIVFVGEVGRIVPCVSCTIVSSEAEIV